ncbi:hypothetical protein Tco_1342581 [Tanacetum coccineum]
MSFVKRSDAAPVFHSKPLDSVKNWNDHFFWVDSTVFPLSVSLKCKILSKDPLPKLSQYDTEACDFLRTHTKPFLCWVGISRYYTLDENCYPTFSDGDEEMDLFAFIRHSDPTKVRIGEREPAKREVKLLTLTEGRTVPLNPPVLAASGDRGNSIDKLFDEGNDDVPEETVAKDVLEVAAEKTKKKRKRKVAGDASGSIFPPKRLREDYHAAASNTGGKSLAAIRDLVSDGSSVPSGVTEPSTVISVPPTPNDRPTNSVSRLNLRSCPPSLRYVVSLDDFHHSSSCSEVKSFAKSPAADAPVTTVAVTTTVTGNASAVSPPRLGLCQKILKFLGILPLLAGLMRMLLVLQS